jgi:hypothetical protein
VWAILLGGAFVLGAANWMIAFLLNPAGLGSHANIYTAAAAAWLAGADPWSVGPPDAVFAGPPPMLIPFVPFIPLPTDVTRLSWFAIDAVLAVVVTRRLRLPAYWIAFPPLFGAIVLGHIEVLILALIVLPGPLAGLAVAIKPYAAFPLLAQRRWSAFLVAGGFVALTLPFLPWSRFLSEFGAISATLTRQSYGDSVFGQPVLMVIAGLALASLGLRRALWLVAPVMWPAAQPIYKTMTLPVLTPILAIAWALPIPGLTLTGLVAQAVLERIDHRRPLWRWLKYGIEPVSKSFEARPASAELIPRQLLPEAS